MARTVFYSAYLFLVDGNYSNWTKLSSCSVTCGKGVEMWSRKCDNPPGKYGGNCSKHGSAHKIQKCEMESCPGIYELRPIVIIGGMLNGSMLPTIMHHLMCNQIENIALIVFHSSSSPVFDGK